MKSGKKLAELIEVLRTGDAIRKKKMTVYGVTTVAWSLSVCTGGWMSLPKQKDI